MSAPRASTDEENAPLLQHGHDDTADRSFLSSLAHPPRKLTNLEKVLAALSVVLLILMSTFIGLFSKAESTLNHERGKHGVTVTHTPTATATATKTSIATTTISAEPTGTPAKKVCLTPECVQLSASILASLNTSVDPCEDFYQYATGGWQASHSIPADRGLFGAFHEVADNNKKIIVSILDSISLKDLDLSTASAEEANLHKLKFVYTSCMDIDHLNDVGLKPFLELEDHLLAIFEPFDINPAPESFTASNDEWRGAYSDDYVLPERLVDAAVAAKSMRKGRQNQAVHARSEQSVELEAAEEQTTQKEDKDKVQKLTTALAWLHSRGVDALMSFNIEGDAGGEDSQIQSLWFYQASGGLPSKEYYEEKPILDLYQSVIKDILIEVASNTKASSSQAASYTKRDVLSDLVDELGQVESQGWPWPWPGGDDTPKPAPSDTPGGGGGGGAQKEPLDVRMDKLALKIVHFERELVRAGADPEYLFNPHFAYNPYPSAQVDKALDFISLPTYLSTFAPRTYPVNITVTHPPYLKSVSKLVANTPDYVLSGYFTTRLAMSYSTALGPKVGLRKATRRLEEVLRGLKAGTEENRQDKCLGFVDEIVGFIAGKEFLKAAFSPEAKKDGEGIIRDIVHAFHDKLTNVSWMDSPSAHAAQQKANALIPKVGYPLTPNTTDPDSLSRWYARLRISGKDFFGNVLGSVMGETQRTWLGLGRARDRQTWEMYPQTVNAYYSPPDGEIVFPAGILQPPFYSHAWPSNLKYGAFGAVAAHELTHAFDNSGSQYDEHGRLRDWWTNTTVKAFQERAACIARQYSKYYVYDAEGKKVYVNGNLTNGEDIGDSGLAQAYLAWTATESSSSSGEEEEELHLPGLDYTPSQLFFLSYARIWAQLTRPATAVSRVRTDPHSPPFWRATGTLRNLGAFHQAFGCKEGSGMNPPKKDQCELW